MSQQILSACHSLKLVPINRLARYSRIGSKIIMTVLGVADNAKAVPGTITVASSSEKGVISKTITYNRAGISPEATDELDNYKSQAIVAIYTDESGHERVCGSPMYPLNLDYIEKNGVYNVTLTGKDHRVDCFID